MGSNKTLPSPEGYPQAFLTAIKNGGGVIYSADLPWTTGSSAKRFRLLIALLRSRPSHALHANALFRWHVEDPPRALILRMERPKQGVVSLAIPIIDRAIGVNPNGTIPPAAA